MCLFACQTYKTENMHLTSYNSMRGNLKYRHFQSFSRDYWELRVVANRNPYGIRWLWMLSWEGQATGKILQNMSSTFLTVFMMLIRMALQTFLKDFIKNLNLALPTLDKTILSFISRISKITTWQTYLTHLTYQFYDVFGRISRNL